MPNLFIYSNVRLPKEIKTIPYPKGKKILIMSPHSDDVSVSCGMTIAKLAKNNNIVPVLFFSGYRGVENTDRNKARIIRENEMEKEARLLKINKPVFLRLGSYDKPSSYKRDVEKVKKIINEQKPDIVFMPKKDDLHPRHRLATKMTLQAVNKADLFFYENPWSLFRPDEFNLVSIFSLKDLLRNLKIIRIHKSQVKRTNFDRVSRFLTSFRGSIVPEQRILGYGKRTSNMKHIYIETFKIHGNNHKK